MWSILHNMDATAIALIDAGADIHVTNKVCVRGICMIVLSVSQTENISSYLVFNDL